MQRSTQAVSFTSTHEITKCRTTVFALSQMRVENTYLTFPASVHTMHLHHFHATLLFEKTSTQRAASSHDVQLRASSPASVQFQDQVGETFVRPVSVFEDVVSPAQWNDTSKPWLRARFGLDGWHMLIESSSRQTSINTHPESQSQKPVKVVSSSSSWEPKLPLDTPPSQHVSHLHHIAMIASAREW